MNPRSQPIRITLGAYLFLSGAAALTLYWTLAWPPLVAWLAASNVLVLPLWSFDKWQSKRGGFRVPEMSLHLAAFLGAAPASFLAMSFLRHKTLKPRFKVLYTLFLVVQLGLLAWWADPFAS